MSDMRLVEISGISNAIISLLMSKRNYTVEKANEIRCLVNEFSNNDGSIIAMDGDIIDHMMTAVKLNMPYENKCITENDIRAKVARYEVLMSYLEKLVKYGIGEVDTDDHITAGHETILRYIDLTFEVVGLHRGAMDDLDSHVMRMGNRMVRSSTRLAYYNPDDTSDWYSDKILTFAQVIMHESKLQDALPKTIINDEGNEFVKTDNGYVLEGMENNKDVLRGLYPLSIPMDCIFTCDFHDMRHIYKRRNIDTMASPELKDSMESAADQVENSIPILGKYLRYDLAKNQNGETVDTHISKIIKSTGDKYGG